MCTVRCTTAYMLCLALWSGGCGGGHGVSRDFARPGDPGLALMVGYLDLSEAPGELEYLQFQQLSPAAERHYYFAKTHGGIFFHDEMRMGAHMLDNFGLSGGHQLMLRRQGAKIRTVIEKPGIYFLGAFRYVQVSQGIFRPDGFTIAPADHPTETEALTALLPRAEGTLWEPRIRDRLAALLGGAS